MKDQYATLCPMPNTYSGWGLSTPCVCSVDLLREAAGEGPQADPVDVRDAGGCCHARDAGGDDVGVLVAGVSTLESEVPDGVQADAGHRVGDIVVLTYVIALESA